MTQYPNLKFKISKFQSIFIVQVETNSSQAIEKKNQKATRIVLKNISKIFFMRNQLGYYNTNWPTSFKI